MVPGQGHLCHTDTLFYFSVKMNLYGSCELADSLHDISRLFF